MRVSSKKKDVEMGEKPTIWVKELLDASGSMGWGNALGEPTKYKAAVDGINQKITSLKEDNNANYIFGVSEFDTHIGKMRYIQSVPEKPINEVAEFKGVGPNGGTPLYQAIAYTINGLLATKKPEDRVLLSIYTDGGENESYEGWARDNGGGSKLYQLMEEVKKNNNFTITFVGTKVDVDNLIMETGISRGNTYTYDGTSRGMKMSMGANVGATRAFAEDVKTKGIKTTDNFYTKTVEEDGK